MCVSRNTLADVITCLHNKITSYLQTCHCTTSAFCQLLHSQINFWKDAEAFGDRPRLWSLPAALTHPCWNAALHLESKRYRLLQREVLTQKQHSAQPIPSSFPWATGSHGNMYIRCISQSWSGETDISRLLITGNDNLFQSRWSRPNLKPQDWETSFKAQQVLAPRTQKTFCFCDLSRHNTGRRNTRQNVIRNPD